MGRPIAERLIKAGQRVTVYNRTTRKTMPLAALGAAVAASPAEAIAAAEVILVMLADYPAVRSVLFQNPRPNLRGRTVIQMSTIGVAESCTLAQRVRRAGGNYLECPVLGSRQEVENGSLILMAGASRAQFKQWSPFLGKLGRRPFYVGAVGQAAGLKLAFNQMIAALGTGFALSAAFVDKSKINRELFWDILRQSALVCPMFEKKWPRLHKRDYKNPNFPTQLLLKDVKLFVAEARRLGLRTDSLNGSQRILTQTIRQGLAQVDYVAVFETILQGK